MKRLTPGYSRIIVILFILFVAEIAVLFKQYKEANTSNLQVMVGITGLTLILIGYFFTRFRGKNWKGDRDYNSFS